MLAPASGKICFMLAPDQSAPPFPGYTPGRPALLVFFETDCPTCQLALPYLNFLPGSIQVLGISQDDQASTREFVQQLHISFPVEVDHDLKLSCAYDPQTVQIGRAHV